MKKIILLFVMLAGCAVTSEKTDETQSNICTIEDQMSHPDECPGPFTPTWNATDDYANVTFPNAERISFGCYSSGGAKHCWLTIDTWFGGFVVECGHDSWDPNGPIRCSSAGI